MIPDNNTHLNTDILVIGSGIAGLSVALKLAKHFKVTLLAKSDIAEGSSQYAQGGIAAVLDPFDSIDSHIQDTLSAGAGLGDVAAIRLVAEKASGVIHELIELGVPFSKDQIGNQYHLTQEGGHSHRRVIHAADHTGKSVIDTLISAVTKHPNIRLMPNHMTIDLILSQDKSSCIGSYALNKKSRVISSITANVTILATGGASKAYLYTSNPDTSTGDGIAMAWRAGCSVTNMEFNQFHPTCLFHPKDRSFLISEAVRGEGGILRLPNGYAFMEDHDPRKDLAPRDIVARAIDEEIKRHGIDCVYLDITHKSEHFIIEHFPTIYARCLKVGIDITKEPIPVVPAAHYTCGGIQTDLNGATDIQNLYAIGETAHTGLHGANRLASNSLLEGLVFAETAYQHILANFQERPVICIKDWDSSFVTDPKEKVTISHDWDEVRRVMWDYVGIVRRDKRLKRALQRIEIMQDEINDYYFSHTLNTDLLELRNLVQVAELMVRSALKRKESRGLHFNLDYPKQLSKAKNTVLKPKKQIAAIQK
ncbi:L-aspartate oxidase [Thiosulfativibrio zosterae]|uniref:L-aspartate oxidase n=1 Tax=Thiosulfativibrio zosterae TaxID=2675053 RepID=A0A6F8PMY6_9GAMM|nr:L-aspartate oxidase [Thiosulfativibrio zosterae]BBP43469.1 L-aspartate oxidase [Thiosulfativibrio zosterae]